MDDGFWVFFWGVVIVVVIGGLLYLCAKDNQRFEVQMQTEYENCIMAKETEYTCKSYIQSMRAKRSADEAGTMAAVAVGMSVGNSGKR